MRFIDTGRPMQPHHSGIVAWYHATDGEALQRWFPGNDKQREATSDWAHSLATQAIAEAYEAAGLSLNVNATSPAYNRGMYDYRDAPDDTYRWRAYVAPKRGVSVEQLATVQATAATLWRQRSPEIAAQVADLIDDGLHIEQAELTLVATLGALPTLYTVGFDDGPSTPSIAIQGLWVPRVR